MKTISLTYPIEKQINETKQLSLAIGFFDGVHLGHRTVIKHALQQAKEHDLIPAVMTFTPHPREVLSKQKFEGYLTPLEEKLKLFAELGVEETYVVTFDQQFASLSQEAFVNEMLVPLGVKIVTTGFNFTFGHYGKGKPSDLHRLGKSFFETMIMSPVTVDGQTVSSTRIRKALSSGQAEEAKILLGRPHRMAGVVIHGDKRGRQIGFPTANLSPDQPYFLPAHGVYIVCAAFNGETAFGIMNIGIRPTFHDPKARIRQEVHLFDQPSYLDLYGDMLQVELLHYLRQETKFSSIELLIQQIKKDRLQSIEWLEKNGLYNGELKNSFS